MFRNLSFTKTDGYKNIIVSTYPRFYNSHEELEMKNFECLDYYDMIINLDMTSHGYETHWIPTPEMKHYQMIGVLTATYILFQEENKDKNILLHCKQGQNRSLLTLKCYKYLMGEYRGDTEIFIEFNKWLTIQLNTMNKNIFKALDLMKKNNDLDEAIYYYLPNFQD